MNGESKTVTGTPSSLVARHRVSLWDRLSDVMGGIRAVEDELNRESDTNYTKLFATLGKMKQDLRLIALAATQLNIHTAQWEEEVRVWVGGKPGGGDGDPIPF